MTPSRHERRALSRRADRILERLHGAPVTCEQQTSARTHIVVVGEGTEPAMLRRADMVPALALLGLRLEGLAGMLTEIAASPLDDGKRYPVLIMIDGWMQCAWIDLHALARGGAA
jgi:hypothetical protein